MQKLFGITLFIISILLTIKIDLNAQINCKVTHIANEGFLIESGSKKVIIDGLFNYGPSTAIESPSDSLLNLLKNALPPFDNVDLITVSHNHRDHFNAQYVMQHLLKNRKAYLLCPKQAGEVLSSLPDYEKVKQRICMVTPPIYRDSTLNIAGINVRVLRLEHSHYMETDPQSGEQVNRHRYIENLGLMMDLDGLRIYHCGDSNPLNEKEYAAFALNNSNLHLAFMDRLFFAMGQKSLQNFNTHINPQKTILMHLGPNNREKFASYFRTNEDVHVFESQLESKTYKFTQ